MQTPEGVTWIALDYRVLVVATVRIDGWSAYIGAVPGQRHSGEWQTVLREGTKLPEAVARTIFGHRPEYGPTVTFCR